MRFLIGAILGVLIVLSGCKGETQKNEVETVVQKELSIPEKIAKAHGFEEWKEVQQISFTFNVDRTDTHFERSWIWNPKTNDVTLISGQDTLSYNRKQMDSIALKTNAGFINDRYWLLAPFNLIWDGKNYEYQHNAIAEAPISKKPMQKLTIVYADEGGYTPGDAYDFYFDDNYLIKEWVFRKTNQTEPSMVTTWENYTEIEGLRLAIDHKKPTEDFNLYFSGIAVKK